MRISSPFLVAAAAALSTACSGGLFVVSPSGVVIVAPLSVAVAPAPVHDQGFVVSACQTGTLVAPTFAVTVVASSPATADHLTVQLIDGSHVGGPMVTVPQSELRASFGNAFFTTGARHVITVRVPGVCGASAWRTVSAEVSGRDSSGASFVAAASGPVS